MNDIISYVLLSREKFMAIDVEHFLIKCEKELSKSRFRKELVSLKGITRMEELGSFEEIMQSIVLHQTDDYTYNKDANYYENEQLPTCFAVVLSLLHKR